MTRALRSVFHIILIKPSHYDGDGYPIQWLRSLIPSNSLAALNGLAADSRERNVLGPDVEIRPLAMDETNVRIRPERLIRTIRRDGGQGLVCLVGVQSNQFPRAVDLARPFLAAGVPVAIGGFHVSGCLSMLPSLPPEIVEAQEMGISIFAGEAEEGRLDEVICDAWNGRLKPVYDHMANLPSMEGQPAPFLSEDTVWRTVDGRASFDLGRGCPFKCSFCTIINVQGRKSRFRSPDDLEAIVRRNAAQGITKFFITDDNFARNRDWEAMLDRLIRLREVDGIKLKLIIQVDTLCHKLPNFIEKACRAGVTRVFIGLENINPDNLVAAQKRQNRITEYRAMLQAWRRHGATTYAGYIIGFPHDTRASVLRDVEIIKRELPIDVLEFFFLTPLPGSEDHQKLLAAGVWMDPDLNKYDLFHRVSHHPVMSDAEWEAAYHDAWMAFYTPEHLETILRRTAVMPGAKVHKKASFVWKFFQSYRIDGVHPLEGGIVRLKHRRDRRMGLPHESPITFYPAYLAETVTRLSRHVLALIEERRIRRRVEYDPARLGYTDLAIAPAVEEDVDTLALFHETTGGIADDTRRQQRLKRECNESTTAMLPTSE